MLYFFRVIYVLNKAILKAEFFRLYHDNSLTKHFDIKKTRDFIERKYFWFKIIVDVNEYVKDCDVCQRMKAFCYRFYNELQSLFVSSRSWEKITINFITKLFLSRYDNDVYDVILIVVCRLSKITLYIHNKSIWTTKNLTNILFDCVLLAYFEVKDIVSNKNFFFISDYWLAICHSIKIKRKLSTTFYFQIDDQTKRQNQTLKHYLRCYCNYK